MELWAKFEDYEWKLFVSTWNESLLPLINKSIQINMISVCFCSGRACLLLETRGFRMKIVALINLDKINSADFHTNSLHIFIRMVWRTSYKWSEAPVVRASEEIKFDWVLNTIFCLETTDKFFHFLVIRAMRTGEYLDIIMR